VPFPVKAVLAGALITVTVNARAATPEKPMPSCSAKLRGTFWPEEANHDRNLLMKFARNGELRMCTRGTWRYRWESPTVHISQIGKRESTKPVGGEQAAPSTGGDE